jgi:hypothetical protein
MPKKPDLKVAVQNDDGSVTFVTPDKLPKSKPVQVYTGTDKLIEKYGKDDWIEIRAVLRELALVKLAHMTFGEGRPDAVIRFELIDVIASKLAPLVERQRELTKAKKAASHPNRAQWQADAAQIWQNHPDWSKADVARLIGKERGKNPDWIRRVISRK